MMDSQLIGLWGNNSLFGLKFTDGRHVFGKTGFHFDLKTSSNSFNCGGMY
ncbi:hypothetical protein AMTRI_Chr05g60360 [Amborella trichopoda]